MAENANQQNNEGQPAGEKPNDQAVEDAAAEKLLAQWAANGADDGEKGKGGKEAILADLAKERKARQSLTEQLTELKKGQDAQRDAFAKALGLKPEETSDADKLTQQITELQKQFTDSQRKATLLEVAASPGVDAEGNALPSIPKEYHHLLTATETEALQAQAKAVAELVAAKAGPAGTPGFAAPAGQGQGNNGRTPSTADQITAAETELAGKERGTPEWRTAQQKVATLKAQQLAELNTKNH